MNLTFSGDADLVLGVYQVFLTVTKVSDGTIVVNNQNAVRDSPGTYHYVLTPAQLSTLGGHKATWSYTVGNTLNTKTVYYDVVVPYTSPAEVRSDYSDLSAATDAQLWQKERIARKVINAFCRQSFDFETTKQYKFRGDNKNTLFVDKRLWLLSSVFVNGADSTTGQDITAALELVDDYWLRPLDVPTPGMFIDVKRGITDANKYFSNQAYYYVTGNWGWEYVPDDINEASKMLIYEYFNDDNIYHSHGVIEAQLGDRTLRFNRTKVEWDSTGNYDVDVILSKYTDLQLRLI